MLIIGREVGQSVIIDENIKVTVLQYGSKLRLSVNAPRNIQITRMKSGVAKEGRIKKRTRILDDGLQIGDCIKITILQTESGLLRFAIDAPKEISIFREELLKPIKGTENHIIQFC